MEPDDFGGCPAAFCLAAVPDVQSLGSFVLVGIVLTVAQEGNDIAGLFAGIVTRHKSRIQKVFCVTLADVSNAVELVFCHAVRVLFKNFIALQQGRHFYPSFAALFLSASEATYCVDGFWLPESLSPVLSNGRKISPNSLQKADFSAFWKVGSNPHGA